jgi:outer membrane protein TolC
VAKRQALAEKILLELASLREREALILRKLSRALGDSDATPAPDPEPVPPARAPAHAPTEPTNSIRFTELEVQRARRHARRLGFPIRRKS